MNDYLVAINIRANVQVPNVLLRKQDTQSFQCISRHQVWLYLESSRRLLETSDKREKLNNMSSGECIGLQSYHSPPVSE